MKLTHNYLCNFFRLFEKKIEYIVTGVECHLFWVIRFSTTRQVSQLCVTISIHGKTWRIIKNIWPWVIAIGIKIGYNGIIWVLDIGISDTVSDHCHPADFPHFSIGWARSFYSCNPYESARVLRDYWSSNSSI